MTIKHTHWLYGHGENKELDFKEPVEADTDCSKCIHNEVCGHVMEKRCVNHNWSSSEGTGCHNCIHKYTKWDKDAVPCFKCKEFKPKDSVKGT